ncbi:hypothetical protein RZO55_20245 [Clostridium boliviensis]|uniref:Uncharacterized protein n=1 Tax=Clostridium boliviensis TaxID=318465 RepID=A0ABU4GQL9_9CLOT|nr:hypothetical protein [Clostridium boliviensis]MDW2799906.1 hypothetical protein [Clostridium boliviensis]
MKIYTDINYTILALDDAPTCWEHCVETEQTREKMFGTLCDACIQGYKYEPQYEFLFKEDGNHERDVESGELLYKTDEDGDKIQIGYACYPFVDYKTLTLIQKQYEDSQKQIKVLNAQIEYMSMMSGIEMEANNE